jgi:hypothetical protein
VKRLKVALDCDISPRMTTVLGELYGARGFEFVRVTEFELATADDYVWADSFKRFGGSIVLSADKKIGAKPHKALAFIENGFASFFMDRPWSGLQGHFKAAHLTFWWPFIERMVRSETVYGRCFRVPCHLKAGVLSLGECEIPEMKIPEEVLAQARRKRTG